MDALNDLPLPVLLGWQDYMRMQQPGKPGLTPESALEMFRKQYGPK